MDSRIDVFRKLDSSSVLAKPGHQISCFEDGYDAPSSYSAECSCGWRSILVLQHVTDWPLDPRLTALTEKYGRDVLLMGKAVSGSNETVVRSL